MRQSLSKRGREVLTILRDLGGSDGWGEVWTHYDTGARPALDFRNFDRVTDSLFARGLVEEDCRGSLTITPSGLAALGKKL